MNEVRTESKKITGSTGRYKRQGADQMFVESKPNLQLLKFCGSEKLIFQHERCQYLLCLYVVTPIIFGQHLFIFKNLKT